MGRDFWVMLGVSLLLVAMALGKSRSINRIEGGVLFLAFIGYQAYLLMNMTA
jgi:cation:H+ antiporter